MPPCQVGKETSSQSFGYIHYLYIYIYISIYTSNYMYIFHYIYIYIHNYNIYIYIYIYLHHVPSPPIVSVPSSSRRFLPFPRSFRRKMPRGAAPDPNILELELYLNYLAGKKDGMDGCGPICVCPQNTYYMCY